MSLPTVRTIQCVGCPWRRDTVPSRDIPNEYCPEKHAALACTIAGPVEEQLRDMDSELRVMACHESEVGDEYPCVGWLAHQLGPGNNIKLRMLARDGRFDGLKVIGEQCENFEETLR